jgi:hypothetical protein
MFHVPNALHNSQIAPDAKHKFGVACSGALLMGTTSGPPEHEKYCVNILHHGRSGMHYVTRRSYQMQKHNFIITCPDVLFIESVPVPPEHEK